MVHKLGEGLVKLDHIATSEIVWIPVGSKVVLPDMSMMYYERKLARNKKRKDASTFRLRSGNKATQEALTIFGISEIKT
jgi:hypothetical protein